VPFVLEAEFVEFPLHFRTVRTAREAVEFQHRAFGYSFASPPQEAVATSLPDCTDGHRRPSSARWCAVDRGRTLWRESERVRGERPPSVVVEFSEALVDSAWLVRTEWRSTRRSKPDA
jgi:hypothetical protein